MTFDQLYGLLMENFNPELEQAYEVFSNEYIKSTGKTWDREKFYRRAENWTFYGDSTGYVAVRIQASGFYKLVGAAGSPKGKIKGFKELSAENAPVWGMVDEKIAGLLSKLGYRPPNKLEMIVMNKVLSDDKIKAVLGNAEFKREGYKFTITYPDLGTVVKYFMGSPQYWKKLKSSWKDYFKS